MRCFFNTATVLSIFLNFCFNCILGSAFFYFSTTAAADAAENLTLFFIITKWSSWLWHCCCCQCYRPELIQFNTIAKPIWAGCSCVSGVAYMIKLIRFPLANLTVNLTRWPFAETLSKKHLPGCLYNMHFNCSCLLITAIKTLGSVRDKM